MVGGAVETAVTYEPYGKLLAQTGSSGTVYGFTGEQYDALTGLVYLRARYYNPSLKLFMSRDPFPGTLTISASQHGYNYAHNNPVSFTDPTGSCVGNCPPPEPQPIGTPVPPFQPPMQGTPVPPGYTLPILPPNLCPEPVPTPPGFVPPPKPGPSHPGYGYAEGGYLTISAVSGLFGGQEIVYDFATFQRKRFNFVGYSVGFQLNFIGADGFVSQLFGFNPDSNIVDDYKGYFEGVSVSLGSPIPVIDVGGGVMVFSSVARDEVLPNGDVGGIAVYGSYSLWSPSPLNVAWYIADYYPVGNEQPDDTYVVNGKVDRLSLSIDILSGRDSLFPISRELMPFRVFALSQAMVAAYWYDLGLRGAGGDS
jgi:RHS repeat-associated protein